MRNLSHPKFFSLSAARTNDNKVQVFPLATERPVLKIKA